MRENLIQKNGRNIFQAFFKSMKLEQMVHLLQQCQTETLATHLRDVELLNVARKQTLESEEDPSTPLSPKYCQFIQLLVKNSKLLSQPLDEWTKWIEDINFRECGKLGEKIEMEFAVQYYCMQQHKIQTIEEMDIEPA